MTLIGTTLIEQGHLFVLDVHTQWIYNQPMNQRLITVIRTDVDIVQRKIKDKL